ncbi:MAG: DUF2069 domain-containing protein [Gammaproteobacteria bacterium]|nr:DUF2069 domain-containing protein [Gammaproteobacteria bacterium]
MKTHPLKVISLISLGALALVQLGLLFWLESDFKWIITPFLTLPLFIPLPGFIKNRRYTYKWVGFLTLLYFTVGITESFANPALRIYGGLTVCLSVVLFVSSVYYSRYLRLTH